METQSSSTQGTPATAGAGPAAGVPLEGQRALARERPGPAGLDRRKRRLPRGPHGCATAQGLYLRFQELRLEAEALRDALAAKRL